MDGKFRDLHGIQDADYHSQSDSGVTTRTNLSYLNDLQVSM